MKRTLTMAAAAAGTFLLLGLPLSPAAQAQQNQGQGGGQGGGWGGALDQLNRAVNPNSYESEQRAREEERYQRERRMEGSSSRDNGRNSGRSEYSRWSDNDLRDQFGRVSDEQRQLQRERRAIEDEMDRRGISRR